MRIDEAVQETIASPEGDIYLWLWAEDDRAPSEIKLKVHEILTHNKNLNRYLHEHSDDIDPFKLGMIHRMLRCVEGKLGGITYSCGECETYTSVSFSCHSRVCVRCGKEYAEQWGRSFMENVLPVKQRHLIFTLPGPLWDLVRSHESVLLDDMMDAARAVIYHLFQKKFGGRKVTPGMIAVLHFTGRDMKDNPHIHMIVTEGGLTEGGIWRRHEFFPYGLMSMYWKSEVLKRFRWHLRDNLESKALIDKQWKMRFKDGTNGYIVKNYRDVLGKNGNAGREAMRIGGYLARYIRHPPVGESRLLNYDGEMIRLKYEWDNKVHETDITVDQFIHAIFSNIPPKGFKVTRRYGLYSAPKFKWARMILGGIHMSVTFDVIDFQSVHVNKLKHIRCPRCGVVMEPVCMAYLRGGRGVVVVL